MPYRIACHYQDSTVELDDGVYPDLESARVRVAEMGRNPIAYGSPQIVGVMPATVGKPSPEIEPEPEDSHAMDAPAMESNAILPDGYRVQLRWAGWFGVAIAGRRRRCESVRVVQRYVGEYYSEGAMVAPDLANNWQDVGFWEECFESLAGKPAAYPEL